MRQKAIDRRCEAIGIVARPARTLAGRATDAAGTVTADAKGICTALPGDLMQRILYVLVGVLVIAAAAVTAFFLIREPTAEVPAAAAPVDPASASVAPASQ